MFDLCFKGTPFTWSNNQLNVRHIKESLDRVVYNLVFRETFPNAKVFHLNAIGSEHVPLLLFLDYKDVRTPKVFRFEII